MLSRPDTPFKPYATYTNGYERVLAPEQRELAIDEVTGCVFENLPEFLDTFFPLSLLANGTQSGQDRLDQFLTDLRKKNLLKPLAGEWPKIPQKGLEIEILPPLAEIFNTVTELCQSNDFGFKITWDDIHQIPPRSVVNELLRPDIVATIDKLPGLVHWHDVLLPVEVKRQKTPKQALPQLITYARAMLREQWNRRFTFGFLFTRREFQVWLFDRAGGIASPTIDFTKEPQELVRVISGVILKAQRSLPELGYDPTMTLLRRSATEQFDVRWRVQGPDGQQYIIFDAPSLNRANVLVGRATRVWKAWKDDESIPEGQRQVFVIKDTWRDDRRDLEGDLYRKAGSGEGLAEFLCDGIVNVDGIPDKTATLIRGGIKPSSGPLTLAKLKKKGDGDSNWAVDSRSIPQSTDVSTDVSMEIDTVSRFHGRIHSRIILSTFGWPIYRFRSRLELIRTLIFAVKGHQHLHEHHVLHRDISVTNILIVPDEQELQNPEGTHGSLIDLDYAIDLETHETVASDERTGTPAFMSDQILTGFPFNTFELHGIQHDLESFFWVLCWLLTKYKGPSLENPDFGRGDKSPNKFFEGKFDTMGRYKNIIIFQETAIGHMLLPHIKGYFELLRPIVDRLAKILRYSFTTQDYNGMHQKFLDVLEDAERICRESPPTELIAKKEADNTPGEYVFSEDYARLEDSRRKKDMVSKVFAITKQKVGSKRKR